MTPLTLAAARPTDPTRDAVLALIAGDPIHARDRAVIVAAIRESVRPDGTVSANDWRPRLTGEDRVTPCVVGAVVCALVKSGVLVATGEWEWSDDTKSRNQGKPQQSYRWSAPVERAA